MLAATILAAACSTEAKPSLALTPDSAVFIGFGAAPAALTVHITGSAGDSLLWTAAADHPWLSVSPSSGRAPDTVVVTPNVAGLAGVTYTGSITFQATGGSPHLLKVRLAMPGLNGQWVGNLSGIAVAMTMSEDTTGRGLISGNGTLIGTSTNLAVGLGGTHRHPNVVITMGAPGFSPATYTAAFTGPRELTGTVAGSGFTGQALVMTRQ